MATHSQAGWVEPRHLALRLPEATENEEPGELNSKLAGGALRPGTHRVGPFAVKIALQAKGDVGEVALSVQNASERPQALSAVIAAFAWAGCPSNSYRFLRNGWQSSSPAEARSLDLTGESDPNSNPRRQAAHHAVAVLPPDRQNWLESNLVTVVGAATSGPACLVAVLERGCSFGVIYLRRGREETEFEVELVVDAVLAPGELRELESVRVALGEDPTQLLEEYAEAHGREVGARSTHPFLSAWSSWQQFFHEVSEEDILRNLDALVAARSELPIELVEIGDGYQRATGDWLQAHAKFPRGLGALAADIREAGFTAGLWLAPFCVVPESRIFGEHADWLLESGGAPFRGFEHPNWSRQGAVHVLDASRNEVLLHFEQLFRELVELGFHYFNLDFLFVAGMACRGADLSLGGAQRLRKGLEAIRSGAGEEAFLLGSACPLGAAVGVVDGMRVGAAAGPRGKEDSLPSIPDLEDEAFAVPTEPRSALLRSWAHRRLWQNAPSSLFVASEESEQRRREWEASAAVMSVTGGAVFVSGELSSLRADERSSIRDTLKIARSVDQLGVPGFARLSNPLAQGAVAEVVVAAPEANYMALFNPSDTVKTRSLESSSFSTARLVDRILGADLEIDRSAPFAKFSLAPHSSVFIRALRNFSLVVFCDFDGTFSVQDVGSTLADRHAGSLRPELWKRYERGEIRAWDYNLEILDGLELSLVEVDAFLQTVELDPGAIELLDWCRENGVPFRILSDGFDYNLNRLQRIHGLRFAYEANRLRYDGGVWRIQAGAQNGDCECGTGTCKRQSIEAARELAPDATIVHIGNGRVSDTCGALAADVAFAKDSLAAELAKRGVGYEPYGTLRDVIPRLETLL